MTGSKSRNVIGAMAVAMSDAVRLATQDQAPKNISASGIALIGHEPGLSIQDLSKALELSHAGAVRLVDRMVADGLVTRSRSAEDHRVVTLSLTAAGKSVEADVLRSRDAALAETLSHLSSDEISALERISRKLLMSVASDDDTALRICRLCNSGICKGCPMDVALGYAS